MTYDAHEYCHGIVVQLAPRRPFFNLIRDETISTITGLNFEMIGKSISAERMMHDSSWLNELDLCTTQNQFDIIEIQFDFFSFRMKV